MRLIHSRAPATGPRGRNASVVLAAIIALALPTAAFSQAWPAKPVKVVVNFPPGGAADQIARSLAQPLQEALGQPVVVENKSGAGGNIGGEAVAKAAPDGYTLLMSSGGMVSVNPHIYPKMPFDPAKDLVPVASAARVLVFLVTQPAFPAKDAKGFLAHLKANPGKLSFGSPGNGSSPHLAAEMMKSQAGVFATHVPYRGAAPALTDLLAGQLDFLFDPGVAIPHIKAGKVKVLAVGSLRRSPLFPDVPTLDEAGLKGFDADTVFGFYAPAGTPTQVIARLNLEINKALALPGPRERIAALGGEAAPMTPEQFRDKALEDGKRFGKVIREQKIVGD
ncbi:Bug family tripartite tricarboxylate transporter substrate binding protein [Variovorax ginsengisoli]|uniref:Tripartite tricarboxylate transporter substrate binding protein n=1 Tax=Variovorax ginsengisoli TaxID=363844 RepID=A0ABT8SIP1_9BURK|nr:tripartite tricarboxylate transporter substrate binding protein [Variovorax ginsengisoli]MDN8618241.1 tripartite tricarboxylate transporter substrate binding protein [Variovorax ginsengisoli]MDO1537411.1 tripartite tricarboxylate transporter substrate binding protein [Variovorax ginsengisoli]